MNFLLVAVLAASPLSVRVLEREHPVRVRLDATAASCDGKPLEKATGLELRVGVRELEVGPSKCVELTATGAALELTDTQLKRRYAGRLRVTLEGSVLKFINEVDVEDYLPAVVEAELAGAKPGALEAQAVVSRTYALASRKRHGPSGYDVCDLAHCQVYRGRTEESEAARAAVASTRNKVLYAGGVTLRPAFFHAACGGHTSSAQDVFHEEAAGNAVSDLDAQGQPRCHDAENFAWSFAVDRAQWAEALGYRDEGEPLEVLHRDAGGRVLEVRCFSHRLTMQQLFSKVGKALGYGQLRSAKFTTSLSEGVLRFSGTGSGHGVGLCQQGAKVMAEQGADRTAILKHYFPSAWLGDGPN